MGAHYRHPATPAYLPDRVRMLAREVAEEWRITVDDLQGPSARHQVAHARQELWWKLRQSERPPSYPRLGAWFGARDHQTVIYGVKQHAKRLERARP